MLTGVAEFVVQGITVEGKMFWQPDWAQQLCDTLGTTAKNGMPYSSYLHPVVI